MMSGSNPTHAALLFLFVFFIASFKSNYCIESNTIFCPEIEKHSLLIFKQSLKDPYNQLASWDGEVNCCKWKAVVCNNLTGHVHELHLQGPNYDQFMSPSGLSGKINPSLLNLKHLRYLDLSQNDFTRETIPSFIGSFTNLEYLNLSDARFQGEIPHSIGNLSNLHTLDVEDHLKRLHVDSLEWLSGLSQLEYLNMNGVDLSEATSWAQVINSLPSLLELHFRYCRLNSIAPVNDVNITSLTLLDLSSNYFGSFYILRWISQHSMLLFLDLSYNIFGGPIPTISNATKLQHIDLSSNQLNSSIPDWIYFCKDLEFVSLSMNDLHDTIPSAITNLTSPDTLDLSGNHFSGKISREIANLCKLRYLDLSYNELHGEISDSFGNMSECFLGALEFLDLQGNNLSGHLTDQFGEFKSLQTLHLGNNSLSGAIPFSLGKLSSLKVLNINGNMLKGVVTESHFSNLTRLEILSASMNHLTLNVSSNWIPPFQLKTLGIGSWNLGEGSQIPSWLEKQKRIQELNLSDTGITGNVPGWFWKISFLDLSHNRLIGKIPYIHSPPKIYTAQYMYLSSNKFSGSLPQIGDTVNELDLSNNSFSGGMSHLLCDMTYQFYGLWILHLGENQLTGELPDCWMKWVGLRYLNIGNNNMSGSIPNSMGFLANLWSLNLGGNKFSGHIPFSLHKNANLLKIDLSNNEFDGSIPTWMGTSLVSLVILILRSNKLSGKISSEICYLNSLQILDLSDNRFSGMIPKCVYNFTAMATKRSLNKVYYFKGDNFFPYYSYSILWGLLESTSVATKGAKLQYDTILSLVTNIDLSKNNLSGDIPKELTSLVELRSLNLSKNHLTGLIPDGIGNMKELESLDLSRNYLSGQIPNSIILISSLNYLNLSYNNLTGKIPEGTQLLGFDASSFIGNNLCGPPLTNRCNHGSDEVHGHKEDNEGEKSKIEWFYVFLSLGYAIGFSIVCTTLVLKKSWREAYFGLLECIWDKLYVYVCIKWRRLTKPSGPSS